MNHSSGTCSIHLYASLPLAKFYPLFTFAMIWEMKRLEKERERERGRGRRNGEQR
jgi:hypothetical protein